MHITTGGCREIMTPALPGEDKRQSCGARLSNEGLPQQGNRTRRLDGEILGRGLDADALVVPDRAEVREERRVVVFLPRERIHTALRIGDVQVTNAIAGLQ